MSFPSSRTALCRSKQPALGNRVCSLYTVRATAAEVAAYFGVYNPMPSNAAEEVYPGMPRMIVTETDGMRELRSMTWGGGAEAQRHETRCEAKAGQ